MTHGKEAKNDEAEKFNMSQNHYAICLSLLLMTTLAASLGWSQSTPVVGNGMRELPDYEPSAYGPPPFSEEVTEFLVHEWGYILRRQNADGSWDSAQPFDYGKTSRMQAGGTVDNITLTSMCGYSLRKWPEYAASPINESVGRALNFVTYMIRSGKLRSNVTDAPWRYVYALRFLLHKYPNVEKARTRLEVEDACAIIVREMADMQFTTRAARTGAQRHKERASLGMEVADTDAATAVVVRCDADSPAFLAGIRVGDRLVSANGASVVTAVRYTLAELAWQPGDSVTFDVLRGDQKLSFPVQLADRGTAATPADLGVTLSNRLDQSRKDGIPIGSLSNRSCLKAAGLRPGDRLLRLDGVLVLNPHHFQSIVDSLRGGRKVRVAYLSGDTRKEVEVEPDARKASHAPSPWVAKNANAAGGWGYNKNIKGSNTFVTADALQELLKAQRVMPSLDIPEELISGPFQMLSTLRKKQPNSDVESYRYDAAGSFYGVEDIRGDLGRLSSAELACLMYCDAGKPANGQVRTQQHLEATLREWLKHRGILDKVKFPKNHADYGIAPWCWMYSYRTTLEAADYLKINDELKEDVRRIALNAFFGHMEFRFEPQLGAVGWIIGADMSKELHDSCQLLDGLATMKQLFRPRLEISSSSLQPTMKSFYRRKYGQAHTQIQELAASILTPDTAAEIQRIRDAIKDRFDTRLAAINEIHREYPRDAFQYLAAMKPYFQGYSGLAMADALAAEW
ncbi:MAG: hypothetical protein ACI8W8_000862 [Rhodothermales bacterium]|jgi:hypothetical protein